MRLSRRSYCLFTQVADHALNPFDDARHLLRVDLIGRVARPMIMRITERRRIGDHHRLESVLREGPMIRPTDAGHETWRHAADAWEGSVGAERLHRFAHERARAQHADE